MSKVNLYIYDISKGMARQLSLPLIGKQIDGVWHTSIVCFGKEYFFGSDGISNCQPCGTILGQPDETVNLGETCVTKNVFHEYLTGLSKETFRSDKYHLFNHNCNTFSNEVALFLTGRKIPSYICDLPQEVMSTPFGAMMAQFFDNVSVQPQVNSHQYQFGAPRGNFSQFEHADVNFEQNPDISRQSERHRGSVTPKRSSPTRDHELSLLPATCEVSPDELSICINKLKQSFKKYVKSFDNLRSILAEVKFDFGDEEETRREITESLSCICKDLQNSSDSIDIFKSLLVVLRATALNLPKIFKYAEGDDIILTIINKLPRGPINDVKLLRIQFLINLLSVYELRNHLLGIESLLRTVVNLTVSSILDGPGLLIKESGCCLAYSLSIVNINDDHGFELSSALLHVVCDLDKESRTRIYGMAALRNFTSKSEQIAELAQMIVPEIFNKEDVTGKNP